MAQNIMIPARALPEIALVAQHADKLKLLRQISEGIDAERRSPEIISRDFAKKSRLEPTVARSIVIQALSFQTLRYANRTSADELYDAITTSLETDTPLDWRKENLKQWKLSRDQIVDVLDPSHPLGLIQKSISLVYAHQNIIYNTNIICDARPVFNETGSEVAQINITYTLEIEYSDGFHRRSFFAALDSKDVASLRLACERADIKTVALQEYLENLSAPVVVSGGETDG